MRFSIMFFPMIGHGSEANYDLLLAAAGLADEERFEAVWMPERHFQAFGGAYPNPALTAAAIATSTSRIQIRAGSVVAPLHHILRVAEEWSIVDNLSHGRVGVALASGWDAEDFVLAPAAYDDRREITAIRVEQLRRLWRGGAVAFAGPGGVPLNARLHPEPTRPELPLWLTASATPATFERAGELGTNVLTALVNQSIPTLASNIARYRHARSAFSHHGSGTVTVMLHTYVGATTQEARECVRPHLTRYLKSFVAQAARSRDDLQRLSDSQKQTMGAFAFERFFRSLGLLGGMDRCAETVARLTEVGVDEIACLIDFGLDINRVLSSMRRLRQVAHAFA